jgi:hypothetical protein
MKTAKKCQKKPGEKSVGITYYFGNEITFCTSRNGY